MKDRSWPSFPIQARMRRVKSLEDFDSDRGGQAPRGMVTVRPVASTPFGKRQSFDPLENQVVLAVPIAIEVVNLSDVG